MRRELTEIQKVRTSPPAEARGSQGERPPIEQIHQWRDARDLLPKDGTGYADWVAATGADIIGPRHTVSGSREDSQPVIPDFEMIPDNFELVPDRERQFAVTFSHRVHLTWLKCVNCHPDPFPGRRAGTVHITMAKIFAGEFCGRCHGKVAFDMRTGCLRCHRKLLESVSPAAHGGDELSLGKRLYEEKCATCHGVEGKGDGPKAPLFETKPRDFTRGVFKIRSTPSGSVPSDEDVFQTLTRGMPGSSMPGWGALSTANRRALVAYVKTFSPRLQQERAKEALEIPSPPAQTAEALREGKELYKDAGCVECHGAEGRGDGTSAPGLTDDWGHKIRPADLTRPETFRGGAAAPDIYRRLMTGLSGTPMPAFGDTLEPEQAWRLVFYVQSLAESREMPDSVYGNVVYSREMLAQGTPTPPAVFPHWFHRIRFACFVCHPAITQMKKGASGMTMDGIREGKFCGKCHDGNIAWEVGFNTCNRCHVGPMPQPSVASGSAKESLEGRPAAARP